MQVLMGGATTAPCDAEKQLCTNPVLTAASGHTYIKMLHQDDCSTVRSPTATANLPFPTPNIYPQSSNPNLPLPNLQPQPSNPNLPLPKMQP